MEGFSDKKVEILMKAIEKYGDKAQILQSIEEMSELTKEICKHFRGNDNLDRIAEEMADVEVMLDQFKINYPKINNKIDTAMLNKVNRQLRRIKEEKEKIK